MRAPRIRRGIPMTKAELLDNIMCSPHRRGCSPRKNGLTASISAPLIRGDDPPGVGKSRYALKCSLHMRG